MTTATVHGGLTVRVVAYGASFVRYDSVGTGVLNQRNRGIWRRIASNLAFIPAFGQAMAEAFDVEYCEEDDGEKNEGSEHGDSCYVSTRELSGGRIGG